MSGWEASARKGMMAVMRIAVGSRAVEVEEGDCKR